MSDDVIRVPARSLKEQFSRGSGAWKEQTDPTFRFLAEGDWWGFPFFSLSASRYVGDKETLCLYWPLGTVVITGPKVLDFYAGFCAHRATLLKPDGNDILSVIVLLNSEVDKGIAPIKSEPARRTIAKRCGLGENRPNIPCTTVVDDLCGYTVLNLIPSKFRRQNRPAKNQSM